MKNYMQMLATLIATGMLSGCLSSTQSIAERTISDWAGKPVEQFFLRYGPPASQYNASGDKAVYRWDGGVENSRYVCIVEIVTEKEKIATIKLQDTVGAWRLSRCDEVLCP